jgi:hypothetical protein
VSRAEQADQFCSALLGGPEGDDRLEGLFVTLWTSGDKRTRWRPADQPGAVASLVAELDENDGSQAVYMSTTLSAEIRDCAPIHAAEGKPLRHGEGNCRYRPHSEHSAGLLGLWVEIDIAGPGHESEHLPADREQAQKIIDAMVLPPTLVVSSGGGLHCWWMLTEPWLVRDVDEADQDAERQRMADLEKDWVYTAKHHAEVLGRWKVDSVFDLARLLRPAGTTNRKITGEPRKVEIVRHSPDATYNPDDFAGVMPDAELLRAYGGPLGVTDAVRIALDDEHKRVLADVNLNAVWARVNSPEYKEADYTPPWLAEVLELLAEANEMGDAPSKLLATWQGNRPDLMNDENRLDAALVRLLFDLGVTDTEGVIEALMCRRLRLTDSEKADKVNPRRRIDYIIRTVARFRVESEQAAKAKQVADGRIAQVANLRLDVEKPEPEPAEVPTNADGLITDTEAADEAFTDHVTDLINYAPATEEEREQEADRQIREEHTGEQVPPRPEPAEEEGGQVRWFPEDRPEMEELLMDELTTLLIGKDYRDRGVRVWALEVRDEGERQKARLMLRFPVDFAWPTTLSRPTRYRPGRPAFTDWRRRAVFKGPNGFKDAIEDDLRIVAQDSPPKEWSSLLRQLVPFWRRDSSGSDIATHAHEWLYDYLMLHHGTGEQAEVGATGRPWVAKTHGWRPSRPPVIYVDKKEFLVHCARQPGTLPGRDAHNVLDHLKWTQRRPRWEVPGMARRPTFMEIEPEEFDEYEWGMIIDVTRRSYEISQGKRGLRIARAEVEGGVEFGGDEQREAR